MKTLFLLAVLAPMGSAAFAQAPAAGAAAQASGNENPNEMICRRVQESGSRLNASRICMTRAQWVDYQRQTRADTEQSQNRRVAPRQ